MRVLLALLEMMRRERGREDSIGEAERQRNEMDRLLDETKCLRRAPRIVLSAEGDAVGDARGEGK